MAQIWQLPLLVIVENNGIAQSTPTKMQLAGSIMGRAQAFDIGYQFIGSNDVAEIRQALTAHLEDIRSRGVPSIVEFQTIRLGPHSKGDDTRHDDDVMALRAQDWLENYASSDPERFQAIDAHQRSRIIEIMNLVSNFPLSSWEPQDAA